MKHNCKTQLKWIFIENYFFKKLTLFHNIFLNYDVNYFYY